MDQYRIAESVRCTHSPDGAIALEIRQGQLFQLNLVGSLILQLLKDASSSEREIVDYVSRKFNVGRDIVASDVRNFLQALLDRHLIHQFANGA